MSPTKALSQSVKTKLSRVREAQLRGEFVARCHRFGIPMPQCEYRFHSTRKWAFDFAWPDHHVALENEGGVWGNGAHVRGKGFLKDVEKYNEAAADGWRVFRTVPGQLTEYATLRMVGRALGVMLGEIGTL